KYLTKEFKNLRWEDKIRILYYISSGLKQIHKEKIIHHNFHGGNILQNHYTPCIADLGLPIPTDKTLALDKNNIFGVLRYLAPEVLNGEPYSMASDIYGFGVLMSVISTGKRPFYNIAHDTNL